jgi:hypothetical protein
MIGLMAVVAINCVVNAPVVAHRTAFSGQPELVAGPGRKYSLQWMEPESVYGNQRLLLCDGSTGSETELLSFPRLVQVLWSASGTRLAVNNHRASDQATVLLWITLPGTPLDLLEELAAQEHQRTAWWDAHHLYLDAVRWMTEAELELRLWGYGDPARPALDRRYVYIVGKGFRRIR